MDGCWMTAALVCVGAYLAYSWMNSRYLHWARRGVPFVKPTLLFGCMLKPLMQRESFGAMFMKIYKELKPHRIGGFYEFFKPMIMVTDPDLIREITVKHFDHFSDRRVLTSEATDPLSHRSLPSLKGAEWRHMRNSLTPAFTTSKLRAMFPLISRCGHQFASFLLTQKSNEPVEFKSAFTRLTNDVIASVAFGVECNAISNPEERFYKYGQDVTKISGKRVLLMAGYMVAPKLMEFLNLPFMSTEITNYFRSLTKGTMEYREKNNLSRPDMLQLLMAAQKGGIERAQGDEHDAGTIGESEDAAELHRKHLTWNTGQPVKPIEDEDIAAQAFIFFFAGYETVATLLSFLAHQLAVYPDMQRRLRDEIDAAIVENQGCLTYDAVLGIKHLDMFISETLRMYPPAGFTDRTCTKSFKVPGTDIVIEEGTSVLVPVNPMHHDPQYFPDPETFDSERFSDVNKKNIKPYTYLPFGAGPHNCIGMRLALLEVKVATCYLLATCELQVCAKTQVPLQLSKKSLMLTTDAGFWLTAAPRDNPLITIK